VSDAKFYHTTPEFAAWTEAGWSFVSGRAAPAIEFERCGVAVTEEQAVIMLGEFMSAYPNLVTRLREIMTEVAGG
jgi:hypothetical protein